jgi:hypothetical protein
MRLTAAVTGIAARIGNRARNVTGAIYRQKPRWWLRNRHVGGERRAAVRCEGAIR